MSDKVQCPAFFKGWNHSQLCDFQWFQATLVRSAGKNLEDDAPVRNPELKNALYQKSAISRAKHRSQKGSKSHAVITTILARLQLPISFGTWAKQIPQRNEAHSERCRCREIFLIPKNLKNDCKHETCILAIELSDLFSRIWVSERTVGRNLTKSLGADPP